MQHQINSYYAVLIITIVASFASLLMIKVAFSNVYEVIYVTNAAVYRSAFQAPTPAKVP